MPKKGLFVPRLHDKNVRKLYHQANRYASVTAAEPDCGCGVGTT